VKVRVVNVEHLSLSSLEEWESLISSVVDLPACRVKWGQWRSFYLVGDGMPFSEAEQKKVTVSLNNLTGVLAEPDELPEGLDL
jgi:hypothetical protein